MKRVLLTGMSGTGKSSVIQALAASGYKAVDTDNGWCEPLPEGRHRWREGMTSPQSSLCYDAQPITKYPPRCR